MNNDLFKPFIRPIIERAIDQLGGIEKVQRMFEQLQEPMLYFIAGAAHARMLSVIALTEVEPSAQHRITPWRDGKTIDHTPEEIRRILDLVRLRLETGSATS